MNQRPNEDEIFEAAAEICDRKQRSKYLDAACAGDLQLRESLDELLRYRDTHDVLLDTPAVQSLAAAADLATPRVDGYEIGERLGAGGFGIVYRAAQREPLRRQVALKVLKPGMDSGQILRRFHAERQVLAAMSHPNIAAVYDAGTTDGGMPFFAMELVAGEPIDKFCDTHQLGIRQRLELIVDVCSAVQHAHQKGVIHRDIKPSNVLVTTEKGKPVAKVIDFGIAKAISVSLAMETLTGQHQFVGTPEYMSPERVSHDGDVDTRADIYAVGVLLFRLLTGKVPLVVGGVLPNDIVQVYQRIREYDPPRASWCVRNFDQETRAQEAQRRQLRSASYAASLRGDLDWILAKALRKDPAKRYQNATELALDIQCYLGGQPVSAGPPSIWYHAAKFIRRHRVATLAAGLALCSVIGGGVISAIGFHRARQQEARATAGWQQADQQRAEAEADRDKANDVMRIMQSLVGATHADGGRPIDYTVRELLDDFARSLDEELEIQPEVEEIVRRTLGRSYWSLGDVTRAKEQHGRVVELRTQRLGIDDPLTAQSRIDLAMCLLGSSKVLDAHDAVRDAMSILQNEGLHEELAWAHCLLMAIYREYGEDEVGLRHIRASCNIATEHLGETHPVTLSMRVHLARTLLVNGELADADSESSEVLGTVMTQQPGLLGTVASANRVRAMVLMRLGNAAEAEAKINEALAADRRIFGENNENVVQDLHVYTRILRQTNRRPEAEQTARQTIELAETVQMQKDQLRASSYQILAQMLEQRPNRLPFPESFSNPRTTESIKYWEKAVDAKREMLGDHPEVARWLVRQAFNVRRLGRHADAAALYKEAWNIVDTTSVEAIAQQLPERLADRPVDLVYATVALNLVESLIAAGDVAEADDVVTRVKTRAQQLDELERTRTATGLFDAYLHLGREQFDEADAGIVQALTDLERVPDPYLLFRARLTEIDILIGKGEFSTAEERLLEQRRLVNRPNGNRFFADTIGRRFVRLYKSWNKAFLARRWQRRISN